MSKVSFIRLQPRIRILTAANVFHKSMEMAKCFNNRFTKLSSGKGCDSGSFTKSILYQIWAKH